MPRLPSPQPLPPGPLGGPRGVPRPAGGSAQCNMPGTPLQGGVQEASLSFPSLCCVLCSHVPFFQGLQNFGLSSILGSRQEKLCPAFSGLDDEDNDKDELSQTELSDCESDDPLKDRHLELAHLGGGLQYKESETSKNIEEAHSSLDVKELSQKVLDISDLSGTMSPVDREERVGTGEEEGRGRAALQAHFELRPRASHPEH
ncbi:uncharacterized protein LOC111947403 isoform X2 [Oryzias latipes]